MTKIVLREAIIFLLLSLAILLVLAVLLYSYLPNNKVVPELVAYKIPEEAEEVINEATEDTSKIILTYEIQSSDIKTAQRSNVYNPGKVDPFAAYTKPEENNEATTGTATTNGTSDNTNGSTQKTTGEDTVNGSTTGGSGTYYTNKGTK